MPARSRRAEAASKSWGKRKKKQVSANRPKRLKTWSDESMVSAINAVREGRMIASVAARSYGVPPFCSQGQCHI